MKLLTFARKVAEGVEGKLGDNVCISISENKKNNNVSLVGLMFEDKVRRIAPTIYVDDIHYRFEKDEITLEEGVDVVIERYEKSLHLVANTCPLDMEYDTWKDKIIYRLVSHERNQDMLEEIPFIPFLDLAITFHILVATDKKCLQTIKITNQLKESWSLSVQELLQIAKKNTPVLLPSSVCNMQEMLADILPLNEAGAENEHLTNMEKMDMIVVSNTLRVNGATSMLYEGILDELAEEFSSDLYIIPSSIHEVIVVPAVESDMYEFLSAMVEEVNGQYVQEEEILSNRVYWYLKDEKRFF